MRVIALDSIKLFSTVKPTLVRKTLIKGSIIAIFGILILSYFGTFVSPSVLKFWGIPVVISGVALIAIGLIPYRRLRKLETSPSEIIVGSDGYIQYFSGGKQRYSIPISLILKTEYIENESCYGIAFRFKEATEEKIIVHDRHYKMAKQLKTSQDKYGCNLFIPMFNRRAYARLALTLDSCLDDVV